MNNLDTNVTVEQKLKEIRKQIDELMTDEKVLKYLELQMEKNKLKTIILNNQKIEENNKCNHELVYFISLYFKKMMYYPNYVCLKCGKEINSLKDNQKCVNENQMYETPDGVFGNCKDLAKVKKQFDTLTNEGLTDEEISNILKEEIKNKVKNKNKRRN